MAKVKALCNCFVDSYHFEGEVFEYDGPKNPHLALVKEPKKDTEPTAPRE